MTPILFETPRLRCRRWIDDDLPSIYAAYSDPAGVRFVGDGTPITMAQCVEWQAVTARNYAQRGYGMFTLLHRDSGRVAGFCGLVHPGGQPEPEVKYALLRDAWGAGLASEAVPALLAYGCATFGLRRIIATVAPGNLASQRVLAKAGATPVAERRNVDGSTTLVYEWRAHEPA